MLRGGNWNNNDNNLRVANRNNNNPTNQNNNIGFRCVAAPGSFLVGQVRRVGKRPRPLSPGEKIPGRFLVGRLVRPTEDACACPVW